MLRAADRYEKTFMTRLLLKQAVLVILLCFLAGFDGCCNIAWLLKKSLFVPNSQIGGMENVQEN